MAKRRMFSLEVIDTDYFLEMPATTQMLYLHMNMRADDDGFVANPKRIMRMIGSSEDDMKLLQAKSFVIPFESGVCVIRHWRIHNYIRSDRYNETRYIEEKQMLTEKESVYQLVDGMTDGIPDDIPVVDEMYPQVRLGKVRLGKDSNIYKPILEKWNSKEGLQTHGEEVVSNNFKKRHKEQIKIYGIDAVLKAIDNYADILLTDNYWFTYKWPLWDFIIRGLDKFIDEADPYNNFKYKDNNKEKKPMTLEEIKKRYNIKE